MSLVFKTQCQTDIFNKSFNSWSNKRVYKGGFKFYKGRNSSTVIKDFIIKKSYSLSIVFIIKSLHNLDV